MMEYVTTEMHEEFVGQFEKMERRFDEMNEKIKIVSEESISLQEWLVHLEIIHVTTTYGAERKILSMTAGATLVNEDLSSWWSHDRERFVSYVEWMTHRNDHEIWSRQILT